MTSIAFRRSLAPLVCGVALLMPGSFSLGESTCPQAGTPATAIFQGVDYGCIRLIEAGDEGRGALHWVRVDLSAPGVELYVTPTDPDAESQGWQYRLRRLESVVLTENLAVGINGAMFWPTTNWRSWIPGHMVRGLDPVVADHALSHYRGDAYMLWFGNDLVPHLRPTRPTPYAELMRAKWAIGAPELGLWAGRVTDRAGRDVDARTAIGVDLERKLLFLAVAERASPRIMMQTLAGLGAREGMLLDGGDASSMVIGKGAQGVPPGAAMSAWRPTATQFGIKAKPLAADASADRPARLSLLHAGTSLGGGN